jgi:hypothetical protein
MKKLRSDSIGLAKTNGLNEYTFDQGVKIENVLLNNSQLSNVRKKVTVLTASTKTLTADDSGGTFVLDLAAGITITLPTANIVGLTYDFVVKTKTTGSYIITGASSVDTYIGGIINEDITTLNRTKWFGPSAAHYRLTMNGTTRGGDAGTTIKFTCIAPFKWYVFGELIGTQGANFVTPFS